MQAPPSLLAPHCLPDDCKRIQSHLIIGCDVIGAVEKALIDLGVRHKADSISMVCELSISMASSSSSSTEMTYAFFACS